MNNKRLSTMVGAAVLIAVVFAWWGLRSRAGEASRFAYLSQPVAVPKWIPPDFTGDPNRTVPRHDDPAAFPNLSARPNDREIGGSAIFPDQLFPIGLQTGQSDPS